MLKFERKAAGKQLFQLVDKQSDLRLRFDTSQSSVTRKFGALDSSRHRGLVLFAIEEMIQLLSADPIDHFGDLERHFSRVFFQVGSQFAPIVAPFRFLQFRQSRVRSKAAASESNGSPPEPGRVMAYRQGPSPAIVPISVNRGRTPARTRELLPEPLAPKTRTKGVLASACLPRASSTSPTAFVLPWKIGACSKSKNCSPRNGSAFVRVPSHDGFARNNLLLQLPGQKVAKMSSEQVLKLLKIRVATAGLGECFLFFPNRKEFLNGIPLAKERFPLRFRL